MVSDSPAGFINGVVQYHWTQVVNIKRDPFETSIGEQQKTLFGVGGALPDRSHAYAYDWNMLPIGQWLVAEGTSELHRLSRKLQSATSHAAEEMKSTGLSD